MKFIFRNIFCFLTLMTCFSCQTDVTSERKNESQKWMEQNGKIKVLTTTAMIQDITREIGGDQVDSLALIQGDLNPHSYQLVKGDDEKLLFADIIFSNGLGLEHGPSLQHYLQNNQKVVSLGNIIKEKDPQVIILEQGQLDPHIWMDVSLWMKIVPVIAEALSNKDPKNRAVYQENARKALESMKEANANIYNILQAIPKEKRYLVTSHDAFNYFTRAYLATPEERENESWRKRFSAPEGLAPESQLSSSHIQEIIDYLKKYNIHILFPESNLSKDSIKKIVLAGREKGLNIHIAETSLYADAMGAKGSDGDSYLKMMNHNAHVISRGLIDLNE